MDGYQLMNIVICMMKVGEMQANKDGKKHVGLVQWKCIGMESMNQTKR